MYDLTLFCTSSTCASNDDIALQSKMMSAITQSAAIERGSVDTQRVQQSTQSIAPPPAANASAAPRHLSSSPALPALSSSSSSPFAYASASSSQVPRQSSGCDDFFASWKYPKSEYTVCWYVMTTWDEMLCMLLMMCCGDECIMMMNTALMMMNDVMMNVMMMRLSQNWWAWCWWWSHDDDAVDDYYRHGL